MSSIDRALSQLRSAERRMVTLVLDEPPDLIRRLLIEITGFLSEWDERGLGRWTDAVAVAAWRARQQITLKGRRPEVAITQALVTYLTGMSQQRVSEIAAGLVALKGRTRAEAAQLVDAAGGVAKFLRQERGRSARDAVTALDAKGAVQAKSVRKTAKASPKRSS